MAKKICITCKKKFKTNIEERVYLIFTKEKKRRKFCFCSPACYNAKLNQLFFGQLDKRYVKIKEMFDEIMRE